MATNTTCLFFYILLCPIICASSLPPYTSSSASATSSSASNTSLPSPTPNTWSTSISHQGPKCCPPNYLLSPAMSCIHAQAPEARQGPDTAGHFVPQHPGLENCTQELEVMEITEEWSYNRSNENLRSFCVENISLCPGKTNQLMPNKC